MAKIIVAFPDRALNRKISDALEADGYEVFRTCMTGNEVMRAFNQCQDGILICAPRLPDRTADALAWDLGRQAIILVIGKPDRLENCEHPEIFRRAFPFTRSELASAVDMLLQLHEHRMPRRTGEQEELIRRAKQLMMRESGLTEPEAHHALQRYAMEHGLRMQDCAKKILQHELTFKQL